MKRDNEKKGKGTTASCANAILVHKERKAKKEQKRRM
jgi:hypothetical protein